MAARSSGTSRRKITATVSLLPRRAPNPFFQLRIPLTTTISSSGPGARTGVLLSRDRGLLMRRSLRRAAFVRGQHPDDQLADVIERFRPPLQPWSLCLACGGTLSPVPKTQLAVQLEPGTLLTQQQFSRCQSCGHIYWHGAHDAMLQQVVRLYT